ncbi:MAG: fimbrillin family protein [Bacteroidales bacterium]|nr:fimbrillin family protein [Bacteroidales bacterium]
MMKFRLSYISLLAGLAAVSCADIVSIEEPVPYDGRVAFCASNGRMITKSGLEYENFDVDTKYLLYGVEASSEYDWTNAILNKTQCYEDSDHYIYYGPEDLHFNENTYDFYGATICSTGDEYPNDIASADSSPIISLSVTDNTLEDLMYSNTLKGCDRTSGILQMNFIHALSKIEVEVAKQNDSDELKYARIYSISLTGTHSSGELDVVAGKWTLGSTAERVFSQTPVTLSTTAAMVQDESGNNDAHMLIFPNEDNSTVSLDIEYSVDEYQDGETPARKRVTCAVLNPDGTPFLFKQNYRYTLSVTISNDGVQVVTVLPKVYEWIDINVESYLGQPVTFGNLMWMDRNLGAISADYENDWYNTVGHYFQFGRNIPYILDVEKFRLYTGDGHSNFKFDFANTKVYVMKYRNSTTGVENVYYYDNDNSYYTRKINLIGSEGYGYWPDDKKWTGATSWGTCSDEQRTKIISNAVECIYTYNHLGEKVYGVKYVEPSSPSDTSNAVVNAGPELVRNPDRIKNYGFDLSTEEGNSHLSELYKFGFGTKVPGTISNLKYPTVWTFNSGCGQEYWKPEAPEYDPCPKGWRLPTKEDLEVLMPTVQINWNSTDYPSDKKTVTRNSVTVEEIIYGKTGEHHVCYILKNPGKANAYRLRIQSHFTEDGLDNKRYFSISRFGIKEEGTTLDYYLTEANLAALWENPIETIKFPACGFIVPDSDGTADTVHPDLRSFGFGTVLRTSDSNRDSMAGSDGSSFNAFNYVQYMSTTDYQLGIQTNSRRSLGDQIRCVRDINAKD